MPPMTQAWGLPVALLTIATIAGSWYTLVSDHVPDPYLDEVFHIPQAQRYCKRDFTWDQKITTPPCLYLLSLLLSPVIGCSTSSLRMLNVGAICVICLLSYDILRILRGTYATALKSRRGKANSPKTTKDDDPTILLDAHSALNISLFSPLFFFSGLYYTDVLSTLFVVLSYRAYLKRDSTRNSYLDNTVYIALGVISLLFRQTNIFWIAVFPAGLTIVDVLRENSQSVDAMAPGLSAVLTECWNKGVIYDPPALDASIMEYALFLASVPMAAIRKPVTIIRETLPYLALLGVFGGFVVWNGGVVLGDKSNHVATIHVPQMLYVWPYILFFSLPLATVAILGPLAGHLPKSVLGFSLLDNLIGNLKTSKPGLVSATLFIAIGLVAVHYNTIVHPFTLADNRHYVFYVFRILRRHYAIKYAAVPFYYLSAWLTIQTVGATTRGSGMIKRLDNNSEPTVASFAHRQPCKVSFIVVWVTTTALSVVSAPLVEPRYFIIPFIIWRLHVPAIFASPSGGQSTGKVSYDMRLILETLWLLAINGAVGYNFLYRGFAWENEPGRVQRFLY